ncbi:hypothetical protein B7463_g2680, partial [Scytalidium lignicola]
MRGADPFSTIPAPLLLGIVKLLPDLATLYSLDKASPAVASLLEECGAEIIEAIMPAALSEDTRNVTRVVAVIRSGFLFSRSLSEFIDTYICRKRACKSSCQIRESPMRIRQTAGQRPQEDCELYDERLPLPKLASSTSSKVLREILKLAFQIQCLMGFCLQTMIDRCMALEPSHLLNPHFRYMNRPFGEPCPQRRPQGQRYQPQNAGPPMWIEQERVHQAIWRVILFFDLMAAATKSELNWPSEDVTHILSSNPEALWEKSSVGSQQEHIKTIIEFTQEQIAIYSPGATFPDFLEVLPRLPCAERFIWAYETVPQPLNPSVVDETWIDRPSSGWVFASGTLQHDPKSPAKNCDLRTFRRLGLFIWSIKRLAMLGLFNYFQGYELPGSPPHLSTDNKWFTWESILSREEIEDQERWRISQFPEPQREFGSAKKETYWYMAVYKGSR